MNATATAYDSPPVSANAVERRAAARWWAWFGVLIGLTAMIALWLRHGTTSAAPIGWLLFLLGLAAIVYRPRWGIYLIVFFTLLGGGLLLPVYPFDKNFSSPESLFYLNDSLIISPLEVYLVVTLLSWLGRSLMLRHKLRFYVSPLTWPALAFLAFVIFGLAWGLGRHGNVNVALWEARAIFYLPFMLILTSNLLEKRAHINHLLWAAMLAIFVEALIGCWFVIVPLPDISFFVWYEYITHNSILWIWMKTGVGGFFTMIFLAGTAIMAGVRATRRMPRGDMAAAALTATLYIVMHFVYAYVDMAWETQSMVYVGAMMGLIGCLERVVGAPVPAKATIEMPDTAGQALAA